jgi:hypothetical protein
VNLKRTDIAPPGGFVVETPTGVTISGTSFTWVINQFIAHCRGNGIPITEEEAEMEIREQTAEKLISEGALNWVHG